MVWRFQNDVYMKYGFYTRPVTKLYILEEDGGYDRRLDEIETNDGEE